MKLFAITLALFMGLINPVWSQDTKIRIIMPTGIGGVNDRLARLIQPHIDQAFATKSTLEYDVVNNGVRAYQQFGTMNADSVDIMITTGAVFVQSVRTPDIVTEDFRAVLVLRIPQHLVASKTSNIHSLADIARMRPPPTSGVIGLGSIAHVMNAELGRKTGSNILVIPYKSAPSMMQDLLSGSIDMAFVAAPVINPFLQDGRVRAIALDPMANTSGAVAPDIAKTGVTMTSDIMVLIHRRVPAHTQQRLVQVMSQVLVSDAERLQSMGFFPLPHSQPPVNWFQDQRRGIADLLARTPLE